MICLQICNPLYCNGFTHTVKCNKDGSVHYIFKGVTGRNLPNYVVLQTLGIVFILENSADPDEMSHYAAFHLGLHCFFFKVPVNTKIE